jgi:hypothetical protein
MAGFSSPEMEQAARLNHRASGLFAAGTDARETANRYIRQTVLFASVLFVLSIAQRFRIRGARIGANVLAFGLLAFTLFGVLTLPRI